MTVQLTIPVVTAEVWRIALTLGVPQSSILNEAPARG